MTFTTAVFGRSSSWRFEAFPCRTAPKAPPSSLVQHDAFSVSLTQYFRAFDGSVVRSPSPPPDMTTVSTGQSPPTGLLPARMAAKRRCTTSQVPEEPHYERALLFDPGGTSALGHYCASMLPSAFLTASAPAIRYFGAQSHGPLTHCLRFTGWVAPPPRKTRFRMAGRPCPGGSGYPLGPIERFQL